MNPAAAGGLTQTAPGPLLLDTSAVIGLVERRSAAIRRLVEATETTPHVSVLTIGELEHGVHAAHDGSREQEQRRTTLTIASQFDVLQLDPVLGPRCYGFVSSRASDRRVGMVDRWILTSTALSDLTLVTADKQLMDLSASIDWARHGWEEPAVILAIDDGMERSAG